MNQTRAEYILLLDDDWLVTNVTRLLDAFRILETNHSIGVVAGLLCVKEPMNDCYGYRGMSSFSSFSFSFYAWLLEWDEIIFSLSLSLPLIFVKAVVQFLNTITGSLGIVDGMLTYKDKDYRWVSYFVISLSSPLSCLLPPFPVFPTNALWRERMDNGCNLVDLGENAILARTEVLRNFPWYVR